MPHFIIDRAAESFPFEIKIALNGEKLNIDFFELPERKISPFAFQPDDVAVK
jgi:hypothetical protein